MANEKKKGMGKGAKAGLGLAALAAAAAGAYYFYGKDGAKHRKQLKQWAVKAKAEVIDRMKNLKVVTEATYNKIVAEVVEKYRTVKNIDPEEVKALAEELKGYWKHISKMMQEQSKKPAKKKTAPRTPKAKK